VATFRSYVPSSPLAAFVSRLWLHEDSAQPYVRERALPTGRPGLMIDLGGDGLGVAYRHHPYQMRVFRESVFYGAHARWYIVEAGRHVSRMGVQFKPGGASALFGQSASELHGMHVSLDALWGRSAAEELRERLIEKATPDARFQAFERALLARAMRGFMRHPAVTTALGTLRAAPLRQTIPQLAHQSGLSHRQFIEVFRKDVGMSPKLFCRLSRFLKVIHQTEHTDHVSWGEIAVACGYYDQSHLAHDFREFAGVSPSAYLRGRDARFPTYLPIASARGVYKSV
jgi:AraC-like DNA-binding protein